MLGIILLIAEKIMYPVLDYILWDVRPQIFNSDTIAVRWYGLLFASGFLIGQWIIARIFKVEEKPEGDLEWLMIYMVVATIVGARLGHCFFYEPAHFLSNPIEILYIWKGGLASHGAAIGILTALYLYSRKRPGQSFLWVVDRIVIVVALGGAFIRLGNLINSEIEGKPTNLGHAFVFAYGLNDALSDDSPLFINAQKSFAKARKDTVIDGQHYTPILIEARYDKNKSMKVNGRTQRFQITKEQLEAKLQLGLGSYLERHYATKKHYRTFDTLEVKEVKENPKEIEASFYIYGVPRHPAQLYESLSTFFVFVFLLWLYYRRKGETPEGLLTGLFLIIVFTLRFFYEFIKESQVPFEDELTLNMGQILSIPAVIAGFLILYMSIRSSKKKNISQPE